MRVVGLGHGLFAIAVASLAILKFTFHDFAPMWHPGPAGSLWQEAWEYGSALILLAASIGLCFERTAAASALTIGAYLVIWAAADLSPILSSPLSMGSWYGFCEVTTSIAGAWILYAALRRQLRGSNMAAERGLRVARVVFGLTCVFYGSSHFNYADYTASMVPTWLPSRLGFAYFTGLSYMAAGVAIILGILPRLAATLVAIMMSLFGLLVWVPSFFAHPKPSWATPLRNEWSELEVNLLLAAAAWIVADSLRGRPWGFAPRSKV
jgi:uncharacterized membrane protein YphA (DoxX/SURF4 family)